MHRVFALMLDMAVRDGVIAKNPAVGDQTSTIALIRAVECSLAILQWHGQRLMVVTPTLKAAQPGPTTANGTEEDALPWPPAGWASPLLLAVGPSSARPGRACPFAWPGHSWRGLGGPFARGRFTGVVHGGGLNVSADENAPPRSQPTGRLSCRCLSPAARAAS